MKRIPEEQLWSWADRNAPELQAHLDFHPEDRSRVAAFQRAMEHLRPLGSMPERIGGYDVIRILGEGGMGVVYEARQQSPTRSVALKMIRGTSSPRMLNRFRREVEALGRLSHPGIATIYEAGASQNGEPWLAMELVQGRSIDRYVREEGLENRAIVELMLQICDATEHAHRQGVIHRDLSPSNILVDVRGRIRILDFGLARLRDLAAGEAQSSTMDGDVVGTLAYMSPEQARGAGGPVDERSDVYSLGVIIYRLLAAQPPYSTDPMSIAASLAAICDAPPQPLRRHDREISPDLETIVLHALEKEPARRYKCAAEFALDLRQYLELQPINARRPGALRRIVLWGRRHPAAATAAALALVAGLTFCAWRSWADPAQDPLQSSVGRGFPTLSPFEKIRWQGATPLVTVMGQEWILVEVNGVSAECLVAYTQAIRGSQFWTKRFAEDFYQVLWRASGDRDPGITVDLELADPKDSVIHSMRSVPMTSENRTRLWELGNRSPWYAFSFEGDTPIVVVGDRSLKPSAIAGIPIARLLDHCRRVKKDKWRGGFGRQVLHALQELGVDVESTITIEGEDATTGSPLVLDDVPLTIENAVRLDFERTGKLP